MLRGPASLPYFVQHNDGGGGREEGGRGRGSGRVEKSPECSLSQSWCQEQTMEIFLCSPITSTLAKCKQKNSPTC